MLRDRSSRGVMARCRSRRDSRREGRALRKVCRLLMSKRFKETISCRNEYGGLSNWDERVGLCRDGYAVMALITYYAGIGVEKAV